MRHCGPIEALKYHENEKKIGLTLYSLQTAATLNLGWSDIRRFGDLRRSAHRSEVERDTSISPSTKKLEGIPIFYMGDAVNKLIYSARCCVEFLCQGFSVLLVQKKKM